MLVHASIACLEALMDTRKLGEFLSLVGPEGPVLLHSIVETYVKETPPVMEELGDALAHRDYHTAAGLVHRLKGGSLSVGASRLASRYAALEDLCHARQLPAPSEYAAIIADYTDTTLALRYYLAEMR